MLSEYENWILYEMQMRRCSLQLLVDLIPDTSTANATAQIFLEHNMVDISQVDKKPLFDRASSGRLQEGISID